MKTPSFTEGTKYLPQLFSPQIYIFFPIYANFLKKKLLNIATFLKVADIYCYTITINQIYDNI